MKLRPKFPGKPGGFEFSFHSHLLEQSSIVRKERFTDVEPGKVLLFENQNFSAGSAQKCCHGSAARAATYHNCVIIST